MKKYAIIQNNYTETQELVKKLETTHLKNGWIKDQVNPDFVFIIGGDGTFLRAVEEYNKSLDSINFVPFKSGGIGFYTNHNKMGDEKATISAIENGDFTINYFDVLNVEFGSEQFLALNELKLINDSRARDIKIIINNELLQNFKGSGLCITTANGSTGFSKSNGGSVVIADSGIIQISEISPINNNNYHSLQAPIILGPNHKVALQIENNSHNLFIDTKLKKLDANEIQISLLQNKVKVISTIKNGPTKIKLLRDIFIKDGLK
ncbi:NAD(+)/NADH kinase [Spiroplasma alleghenense]|uniref:NAD kinase n=1 Tax=Spiroplasma alleghenense TaxID=216931 RepID=A0A345Z4G6_9MOLU|nr:NAD(+)/NADH kinase [Spiroplasma alleghenense]AXK51495.1 inorganic polyphosphate/ATP-NAD kinase [Spiroplasma alleghenense]